MMNNTSEYMKDRIFEITGGGWGGWGEDGSLSPFLDPPLQVDKYKKITGLDVYSLDIYIMLSNITH